MSYRNNNPEICFDRMRSFQKGEREVILQVLERARQKQKEVKS